MSKQQIEFAWLPGDAPGTLHFNPVAQQFSSSSMPCQITAEFSIFFDGTRNHADEDRPSGSHSNVARLFDVCLEKTEAGQSRLYIPGVGTPFPPIGEHEPHPDGARDGVYGDRRLRYAYLHVANRIARLSGYPPIVEENEQALIRAIEDEAQVKVWTTTLVGILAHPKPAAPHIAGITLDLFGFSRGATAARAFLNQLIDWTGGKQAAICGIPLRVRFMGLFDTVASVHVADSVPILPGDGHLKWAEPRHMKIPGFVEQCVHMIAAHEARNSFPLTTIGAVQGDAPQRLEIIYPGMHSDVGGGYGPITQGKGTNRSGAIRQQQQDMLSQIPLNDMYRRALSAGVPLMDEVALTRARTTADFAISPELQSAFDAHQSRLGSFKGGAPLMRQLHHHYLDYIGWRRSVLRRNDYIAQPFVQQCKPALMQDYINLDQSNVELHQDVEACEGLGGTVRSMVSRWSRVHAYATGFPPMREMYKRYWNTSPDPSPAVRRLLEDHVHDSRSAFVLTDPQCQRDYDNMHKELEEKDRRYREARRRYDEVTLPEYKRRLEQRPASGEDRPPPPIDPLNVEDRRALKIFRDGGQPIFTDARPASVMDGKLDVLDGIATSTRREPRWSYLRRRQVFSITATSATTVLPPSSSDEPSWPVKPMGMSQRLTYADGLS